MKKLSKIVSVGLSLVLCAGMVAPAFAASFRDLQDAIDGKEGVGTPLEDGRTGYGSWMEDDEKYEIEAWQSDRTVNGEADGQTRYVQLNNNVKYDADEDTNNKYINIASRKDVTLDLNGNDIDAGQKTGNSVVKVENGSALTLNDSTARVDEEGNYISGKITGGNSNDRGGGVDNKGTLTMNGGTISGNTPTNGGGVYIAGRMTMNGGAISGNTATTGGGVYNWNTFNMSGGSISGNRATYGGGVNNSGGTINMNGGSISGNKAYMGGGVRFTSGTFNMNGGETSGNTATEGGGVYLTAGTFNMNGGEISGNTAGGVKGYSNLFKFYMTGGAVWDNEKSNMSFIGADDSKVYLYKPEWETCAHEKIDVAEVDGTTTYTCNDCGMFYSEPSVKDDPYGLGVWTEDDATCVGGLISYNGTTYTTPANPNNHANTEVRDAKEATYDEEGYTGDTYCLDCDELIQKGETIPKLERPSTGGAKPGTNPGGNTPTGPIPPVNPVDPVTPANPVTPVDPATPPAVIEDTDVPLAELPELADEPEEPVEAVDIDDPEVPLAELPELADEAVDIDDPAVPLSDVPQTGEASTAIWLAVLLACGMGLVYLNTGKRKENA